MESRGTVGWVAFETIRMLGIAHAFCVPGESYLSLMDSFYGSEDVALITARHEEGAGLMAEAYAKATGKPGVLLVTRGPGITHASIALHTAQQDSTPLVTFVGQVPTGTRYREGFQEMDLTELARPMTKWAVEVTDTAAAPRLIAEAFTRAAAGRPGPVLVSLPENLDRAATDELPRLPRTDRPPAPNPGAIAEAADLLAQDGSVALIAGLGVLRSGATELVVELAEQLGAGVYTGWRRFDAYPNDHPHYLGNLPFMAPELLAPLFEADTVLALGTRLGEFTSATFRVPGSRQRLVQVDLVQESLHADAVGILADCHAAVGEFIAATRHLKDSDLCRSRMDRTAAARLKFEAATSPRPGLSARGAIDPTGIMYHVNRILDRQSAITSDAGIFAGWLTRYYKWSGPGTFYGPTAGGMGYAVPAAVGAKLARPDHPAVAFAGDGGFAMTMSEVQTAVRLGLAPLVFLVFNNNGLGTIRRYQDQMLSGRRVATDLGHVDFAMVATGMGALGMRVTTEDEFAEAFTEALSADVPVVIDISMDESLLGAWDGFDLDALMEPG